MKSIHTSLLLLAIGATVPLVAQDTQTVPPAFEKGVGTTETGNAEEEDPFDPDESAPKMIQVQLEYIELPHEALTKLLFLTEPKTTDAGPLRKTLQEMVARNEAKVLETQLVVSKSSNKSTTDSIHEFIYPTEFEPPSLPCTPKSKDSPPPMNGPFPANPAMPTAFDTRNLGSNLEVEPTAGMDGVVDIRMAPQLVWHTRDTTWQETKDSMGNLSQVRMPDIYTLSVNASVTCISGQYTLVSVQSPMNEKGETDFSRKVVVLLKCDVLSVR
jgi:hypothetical protein